MRVVATLTTIPTREESVLKTIESIQQGNLKPDAIYVNLPKWYPKFGKGPDPSLAPRLEALGATVNHCDDYGVLTKLLPTLQIEKDPETLIIVVDDDAHYKPQVLECLVATWNEFKPCAVGFSGLAYPETVLNRIGRLGYQIFWGHGNRAEMLECAFGFLMRRGDMEGFPEIPPFTADSVKYVYFSDDYLYSKHLDFKGVPKRVACLPTCGRFGDDWSSVWTQNSDSQTYGLSHQDNNLYNFLRAGQIMTTTTGWKSTTQ